MPDIERTEEANGGDVTKGEPIRFKLKEYNRTEGSDGFSQTGGKGKGLARG